MFKDDRNEIYQSKSAQTPSSKNKKPSDFALKITVWVLSIAVIGLTVGLTLVAVNKKNDTTIAGASFQRAYYDLVAQTSDLSVSLSKLDAASTSSQQKEHLYDIWKNADLAGQSLASLSSGDSGVESLLKFMNQLSDYCHFLAQKIEDGETLTADKLDTLDKLDGILKNVNDSLSDLQTKIQSGELNLGEENALQNALGNMFDKFSEPDVEYPQLIYDGPFTDALKDRETKGLDGSDIDENTGRDIVAKIYKDKGVEDIVFNGEWNSDIKTLNYTVKFGGGETADLQLAKQGGSLILLTRVRDVGSPAVSSDKAVQIANDFLLKIGYEDMKSVWVSNISGIYYVNLVPVQSGVILYPDVIKVKVSSDDGAILGIDAKNYAFNHVTRENLAPSISLESARSTIKSTLNPNEGRLAVIPYRTTAEKLTYEFACDGEEGYYFIYIDAFTGEEADILFVVDSENGTLLM